MRFSDPYQAARGAAGFHRERLPLGDGPGESPRLVVIGDAGKKPAQLDGGRKLAALIEGGTDRVRIPLGDDKHRRSMGALSVVQQAEEPGPGSPGFNQGGAGDTPHVDLQIAEIAVRLPQSPAATLGIGSAVVAHAWQVLSRSRPGA